MEPEEALEHQPIVLFDGECKLCNGLVKFIVSRDDGKFSFASLQSDTGSKLLENKDLESGSMDTFVAIVSGEAYTESKAAIKVLEGLGGVWRALAVFLALVPGPIRDFFYRTVSSMRYSLFGRIEECVAPGEMKGRILE